MASVLAAAWIVGCGSPSTQPMDVSVDSVDPDIADTGGETETDVDEDGEVDTTPCVPTGPEICNGIDDDCDGAVDEDFPLDTDPTNCGACGYVCITPHGTAGCMDGECTVVTCETGYFNINGAAFDGCEYACLVTGTPESVCDDGIDDDCDGRFDGDDPDCELCVPEFCDGADNDCDTFVDEDFDLRTDPLNCGDCGNDCPGRPNALPACVLGECTITCLAGYANLDHDDANGCEAACIPDIDPSEFDCDGVDDDCDGVADEDYIPYTCGVGLCVTNSVCWAGEEVCEPLTPLSTTDALCDNLDEDCDGTVDEEFAPSDLCIGLCQTTATCTGGSEICGTPEAFDSTCDNIDDDCDAVPDDDYIPYTCGTGGCTRMSTCIGGLENCVEGGPAPEICNGSDDDCDDIIDNGDPTSMCSPVPDHGTGFCDAGVCSIGSCDTGYFDADGVYGNGCECTQESSETTSTSCTSPHDLGLFADSGDTATLNGNIVPAGDEDWYHFTAPDSTDTSCDTFDVEVAFTANPGGVFRMDIYRNSCGDADPCTNVNDNMTWYTNMTTGTGSSKRGECPCSTAPNEEDLNQCSDNSAEFWVKVYRAAGAPVTCDNYSIRFSNGL